MEGLAFSTNNNDACLIIAVIEPVPIRYNSKLKTQNLKLKT